MTIIPESAATPFKELLGLPADRLHGPAKSSLNVCGQFTGTLQLKTKIVKEEIFVVKNLHSYSGTQPSNENLYHALVQRNNHICISRFPQLFTDSKGSMKSN